MTGRRPIRGAKVALWWVGTYTRTAPAEVAVDRRDEVRSDLHEHSMAGLADGATRAQLDRQIVGRVVRGVPADLAWRVTTELSAGRLRWHLQHPTTVHSLALLMLVPLGLTADKLRDRVHGWTAAGPVGIVTLVGCSAVVAFSLVSFAHLRPDTARRVDARRVRAVLVGAMSFSWALAGVWRFAPTSLAIVSTVAWVGFGAALLAYLVTRGAPLLIRLTGLALGKVSS